MLLRVAGAMALGLFLSSPPSDALAGGGQSGLIHRVSCGVVRYYVAKYSASAAEMWARSHGASEAEIETARRCLTEAPAQTAQAAHWYGGR
ncbi:MAG: hypothetical protein JOZ74_07720 [Bradyrhizobium sp.]|nr:hypothetical protein [Bradyrhizobium sp.]